MQVGRDILSETRAELRDEEVLALHDALVLHKAQQHRLAELMHLERQVQFSMPELTAIHKTLMLTKLRELVRVEREIAHLDRYAQALCAVFAECDGYVGTDPDFLAKAHKAIEGEIIRRAGHPKSRRFEIHIEADLMPLFAGASL